MRAPLGPTDRGGAVPTYEYACKKCGEHLEVVQSFHDEPLTVCPSCRGQLRKVFSPVGITFKGSGFYKTDSRSRPKETSGSSSGSSPSTTSPANDAGSSPSKSDSGTSTTSDKGSGGAKAAAS